jgi:hypothetical protein
MRLYKVCFNGDSAATLTQIADFIRSLRAIEEGDNYLGLAI